MSSLQFVMQSPIGPLYLVASSKGLQGVFWKSQAFETISSLKNTSATMSVLSQTIDELDEYFSKKRKIFTIPLDIIGTPFQKSVWTALREIPYGKTCSYSDIAISIKNPKAVRAVGLANNQNPFSIIIPCHRVIAKDGSLRGYAGGLSIKSKLLEIEQLTLS